MSEKKTVSLSIVFLNLLQEAKKATFEEFKKTLGEEEYNKHKGKVEMRHFEGILEEFNFENSTLRRSSLKTDLERDGFFKGTFCRYYEILCCNLTY